MSNDYIAKMIDLSCVQANSSYEEMQEAIALADKYNVAAVFVLPAHLEYAQKYAKENSYNATFAATAGFPSGSTTTASKIVEAQRQIASGCREVDMVNNITWLKANELEKYRNDIQMVKDSIGDIPLKVILECHYLTNEQIATACEICAQVGVAFVKTGTGWAATGATLENVTLMKKVVGDRCEVKAAGGVRDIETVIAMIERGVTRFGIGVRTAKAILGEDLNEDLTQSNY
ncbi:deoxyribose-phosphate aldolase [Lentisphaerota bacterium WC36G]|nr:deoxyribose-phosphate aldolase [Lentisphaerae bacterium WC36]